MSEPGDTNNGERFKDFTEAVVNALPELDEKTMERWTENPTALKSTLIKSLSLNNMADLRHKLLPWADFYKKYFNLDVDINSVEIPSFRSDFERLILISKELTPQWVFEVCRKVFNPNFHGELDGIILRCERRPMKSSYAAWAKNSIEADEQLANMSVEDLKKRGVQCMNLIERLILGLKHFEESGEYLDREGWTLCAGSLHYDVIAPRIGGGNGVEFSWCSRREKHPSIRARQVIV